MALPPTAVVWLAYGDSRQIAAHADTLILQETKDLHGTVQDLNAAIIQVEVTTDELRTAAESQETYWKQTAQQTALLAHNLNDPETGMLHNFNHAIMALTLDTHTICSIRPRTQPRRSAWPQEPR